MKRLIFALVLLGSSATCWAATWSSNGTDTGNAACNGSVDYILANCANDGDIITLPSGTFSWTTKITITKAVTIQGATTVDGAGTASPTVADNTIIKDDIASRTSGGIFIIDSAAGKNVRISGITFTRGTVTTTPSNPGGCVSVMAGNDTNYTNRHRVDHCHMDNVLQPAGIWIFGGYGVADHNFIYVTGNRFAFDFNHAAFAGKNYGFGTWEDFPWYGTDKWWFMETNTIKNLSGLGICDGINGGRVSIRHNYFINGIINNHGTESGINRGARAMEIYDNTFDNTTATNVSSPVGSRSGTYMAHDNTIIGTTPSGNAFGGAYMFRQGYLQPSTTYGYADGTSPWDYNATEADGTHVDGNPPYLFESGGPLATTSSEGSLNDTTKAWTANQWCGYSVKNTSITTFTSSFIESNTNNRLNYNAALGGPPDLVFAAGQNYEIHKLLIMMDQVGRGKTDAMSATSTNPPKPFLVSTGQPGWPHSQFEPVYQWNNKMQGGTLLHFSDRPCQPTVHLNVDVFDLGSKPVDTIPTEVKNAYTASVNGQDFTADYVYPHPLVSGAPPPSPTPTPTATATATPTPTSTPSPTPTATATPTATPTPLPTPAAPVTIPRRRQSRPF